MKDDELIESLRRTLQSRAAAVRPTARPLDKAPATSTDARRPPPRRLRPRPSRRLVLAGLGMAAALTAAAVAVGVVESRPTHTGLTIATNPPSVSTVPSGHTVTPVQTTPTVAPTTVAAPPPPVLPGFEPLSVTFVSAWTGWVLGTAPCPAGRCAALARTSNGGMTWYRATPPPITFENGQTATATWIRFANLYDGWVVTPTGSDGGNSALWYTSNGGRTWSQVADPAGDSATMLALEASNEKVHLVTLTDGDPNDQIFTGPIGNPQWGRATATVPLGAGPVPSAQIVLQGSVGWIVDVDRTVIGGARLATNAGWAPWTPPCSDAYGAGVLAAASPSDLVAACDEGAWGGPTPDHETGEWLYSSADGGNTFTAVGPLPSSIHSVGALAAAAGVPSTVVAATDQGLEATFDGGHSWQNVYPASAGAQITFVGFTTATQGVAIQSSANGSAALLITRDGGRHWAPVSF